MSSSESQESLHFQRSSMVGDEGNILKEPGWGGNDGATGKAIRFITTANVPEGKRFAFWQQACAAVLLLDCARTRSDPFFGEFATTRVNDVRFTRMRCLGHSANWTGVRQSKGEMLFLALQLDGSSIIAQDGREAALNPGDLVCYDSRRPFSAMTTTNIAEQLIVQIPRDNFLRRIGDIERLTARIVRGNTHFGALLANFTHHFVSAMANVEQGTAKLLEEAFLNLTTAALGELMVQPGVHQNGSRTALLCRAKAIIDEQLYDPGLNPEKVAAALRISARYLRDLFHEENTTVCNWIWQRRLEKCHRNLSDPRLASKSVSQIAFDCGFNSFPHFTHKFKAAFSTTPSQFRREQGVLTAPTSSCS